MLERLRGRLTYSNVVATIALFLALGGGAAWAVSRNDIRSVHIAPNAVKGKDVKEGSLNVGSGMVFGRTNGLPGGAGTTYAAPTGTSSAQSNEGAVVQGTGLEELEVKDFYVATSILSRGSRTFTLRANGSDTGVSCTTGTDQNACASEETFTVPEASSLSLKIVTSGSPNGNVALWGYTANKD